MKSRTDEMNDEEFLTYLLRTRWKDRAWQAGAGLLTGGFLGYVFSLPLYACLVAVTAGTCASLAAAYLHFTEPKFVPSIALPDEDEEDDIYPLNPDAMTDEELAREISLSRRPMH
ncbi:hypothetical protein GOC38_14140 [Sinorhizobium meliloti]|nr:hypothetical protein [Sinorhizobium meliloti]MDX0325280.1 hypothetical protein [Sinorhizobium meliloti]